MKTWIKYGLIGLAIFIILTVSFFGYMWYHASSTNGKISRQSLFVGFGGCECPVKSWFAGNVTLNEPFGNKEYYENCCQNMFNSDFIIKPILFSLIGFLLGAIIGLIVQKVRKK